MIGLVSKRSPQQHWLAAGIAVGLAVLTLATNSTQEPLTTAAQMLCCLAAGLAFVWPVLGAGLLGATQLFWILTIDDPPFSMTFVTFPLVIAFCAARGRRFAALFFALLYFTLFLLITVRLAGSTAEAFPAITFWMVMLFAPLVLGEGIWRFQRRSERLRREQVLVAEQQRHAIARDLHDHVAYATTTMVMKADQARLRGGQDPQTLADLEYIAATGRSATADVRTMLALLREAEEGEVAALPDHVPATVLPASRLEEVLEAQRAKLAAFNFDVNIALNGDPTCLPDRQSAVLARVLTEVASNITKHGDPCAEVNIMIDLGPEEIEAVLVNTPRPTPASTGHRGLGVLGLREIVDAVGGTLSSGMVGKQWINHLILPVGGEDGA